MKEGKLTHALPRNNRQYKCSAERSRQTHEHAQNDRQTERHVCVSKLQLTLET